MSELSPGLGLPYLQPSQAQKHVTHNTALQRLDQLVQLRLSSIDASLPPVSPAPGEMHALGGSPTGAWAGQGGELASWDGSAWQFVTPQQGWLAWDLTTAELRAWSDMVVAWQATAPTQLDVLGIATPADAVNRLAVSAPATLLSHDGGGHQLKINKATDADTASLLFQSNWTGHAEMGLAGDSDFVLKLSPDGSSWTTVLRADPAGVQLDVPLSGSAVQADAADITPGRLMRADYGYGPGNLLGTVSQLAGQPTGAVIERGSTVTGDYVRWADGSQICHSTVSSSAASSSNWAFPASFIAAAQISISANSAAAHFASHNGATASAVSFDAWDTAGARVVLDCDLVAVGRWV